MTGVAMVRRGAAAACLVATFANAPHGVGSAAPAATSKPHRAPHPKAPVSVPVPPPPAENLVVHGAHRYQGAPMPNQAIHDPADTLRDAATGAPIGRFGHAYMDANPVPPVNPGLQGDQGPIAVGVQR